MGNLQEKVDASFRKAGVDDRSSPLRPVAMTTDECLDAIRADRNPTHGGPLLVSLANGGRPNGHQQGELDYLPSSKIEVTSTPNLENQKLSPEELQAAHDKLLAVQYLVAQYANQHGIATQLPQLTPGAENILNELNKFTNPREDKPDARRPLTLEEKLNFLSAQCHSTVNSLQQGGLIDTTRFIQLFCALETIMGLESGSTKLNSNHIAIISGIVADTEAKRN